MSEVLVGSDVFKVSFTVGDHNADGVADVTVDVEAKLPVFGEVQVPSLTVNIPVDELVKLVASIIPILPAQVAAAVSAAVSVAQGALKHK